MKERIYTCNLRCTSFDTAGWASDTYRGSVVVPGNLRRSNFEVALPDVANC
jgi:hypothetical protein